MSFVYNNVTYKISEEELCEDDLSKIVECGDDVCCPGQSGLIMPFFGPSEQCWPTGLRATLYMIGMLWCFLGVAIVADLFMAAIEEITAATYVKKDKNGKKQVYKVWCAEPPPPPWRPNAPPLAAAAAPGAPRAEPMRCAIGRPARSRRCRWRGCGELRRGRWLSSPPPLHSRSCRGQLSHLGAARVRRNPVVANLSLMALGSSAPEILLNVIEITLSDPDGFYAGALGPSTIVGSAAFNLLVICAVCVMAISDGTRKIEDMKVYALTASTSVFAYVWLLIILIVWTPDVVTIEEGLLTFAMFWVLLIAAYAASKNFWRPVSVTPHDESMEKSSRPKKSSHLGERNENVIKNTLKMAGKMEGLDHMDDETKVELILDSLKPVTVATHTRNAMSWLTGKKKRAVYDETTGHVMIGDTAMGTYSALPSSPAGKKQVGEVATSPGSAAGGKLATLAFKDEAVEVMEDAGKAVLVVVRTGGLAQTVSCSFASADISATAGKDYEAVDGTLTFEPDVREMEIKVPIIDDDRFEKSECFRLELKEPSSGAELDKGGSIAMITIANDDDIKQKSLKLMERFGNKDKMDVAMEAWKEQFRDAIKPATAGDKATMGEMAVHILTVVFKVAFALVPPVHLGGGWPAFYVALGFIALMTVLVGDLAGFFGCVVKLPPAITAITFVALGTSMPDTFASKAAAVSESTADNCVGNVTGSNCVNVFLGLGLPWTIGAIYWSLVGTNNEATARWAARYAHNKNVQDAILEGKAVFVVEAGDLGLSVLVFTGCALVCLLGLFVRRKLYGGELGGPAGPKRATAAIFCVLWLVYVLVSSFQTDGVIDVQLGPSSLYDPPSPPPSA